VGAGGNRRVGKMSGKRASISDVARLCGVSTATVSHVINSTRFVSEEIRQNVLSAVRRLHYYPSDIARSLSTKKTKTVGVVISDIQNPFYGPLIRGIEEVLLEAGYNILLGSNDENELKQNTKLRVFLSKGVDGLILTPAGEDQSFLEVMDSLDTQIVLIDRAPGNCPYTSIVVDNRESSRQLIDHLIADGHRTIGMVRGVRVSTIEERYLGYTDALSSHDIPVNEALIASGGSQQLGGYYATKQLLGKTPRPSAVFASNNLMTLGAIMAIKEEKISCPEQLAIVGFDDTSWAPFFTPPLTMVSQPVKEIGLTAAKVLLDKIEGKDTPGVIHLPASLKIRGSCSLKCLQRYEVRDVIEEINEYPFSKDTR
jgi:LacI family transcriptional regulator